jgi:Spy/CpxP family protein refolding chaperone
MKSLFAALLLLALPAAAQDLPAQPYAGLQQRAIKGLSDDDIAELRAGRGWGLALPAELNGKPGPAHLLELADELELTPEQVAAIQAIHAEMQAEAVAAGERLIEAERALSDAFTGEGLTPERLSALIAASEAARAELRFIHLSRHLETAPLLTPQQIARYGVLRGYAEDPCASVPEGHDPEMWRRHNHCG